jgi:hypothetical protein
MCLFSFTWVILFAVLKNAVACCTYIHWRISY